jgi:hypothetical protein
MQRGPKLKNPVTKKLAGTYKPSVDGKTAPLVQLAEDIPVAPAWLTAGAKDVWADDLARVVACGARETDSHFFAVYCEMMARFIAGVKAGDPPNAAFVSELRKEAEMLGIAGAKARLSRLVTAPEKPTASPFSLRPK